MLGTLALATDSGPFAAHWCRHLVRRPYRRGLTGGPRLASRPALAGYDAAMNLLLDGWTQLTGRAVRPGTGAVAIRLSRLIFAFDDAYEHLLDQGHRPHPGDVLAHEAVRAHLWNLRDLLRPHPERRPIRAFLADQLDRSYDRYTALQRPHYDIGDALESAALDSGGFGACLAQVIGLFNGLPPDARTVRQFTAVGILAKTTDDVLDLFEDQEAGRPNLALALLRRHPTEHARLLTAGRPAIWLTPSRWRRLCPGSHHELTRITTTHLTALTASRLALAARLILWPVSHGAVPTEAAHVTDGPPGAYGPPGGSADPP
jgi:hypothetical protein